MSHDYLSATPLLDYQSAGIRALVEQRGWAGLPSMERIGAAYEFVRNEILFGYNTDDALPASKVLADGYGQCNTKGTLLMALLRALDIPCRFHGFTIDKGLQRGVVPELVYPLAPRNIIHSWVEVHHDGKWLDLEGFILDQEVLSALQAKFPERTSLCAYGAGTDCLQKPNVAWAGKSTYIQKTGINHDFGTFDNPDAFYAQHRQLLGLRGLAYRLFIRHWMNRRVAQIRTGRVPTIPGGESNLVPPVSVSQINEVV
ncbi:transglutaminase-like domain-containing protein [Actibacterium lipolyticum]|uniref:Transglutaminase-like superfamily protein n=1 Tax=Actibacterium lipolyticum TaxID=1524263 RepID=A0A238JLE6_9RHOB|nr:transglutaminase family protein [Actibacterium lipolyticum]SMX31024.1 Transglutaminase-like superfamily protein [Actibacterium lipolyticum]